MTNSIARWFATSINIFLFLWIVPSSSHAGVRSQVQLLDGTLIQAEIISFSNGVYKLRSESLGTISVAEDRVQSILPNKSQISGTPAQLETADPPVGQKVQGLQQKLTSDPKTMKMQRRK